MNLAATAKRRLLLALLGFVLLVSTLTVAAFSAPISSNPISSNPAESAATPTLSVGSGITVTYGMTVEIPLSLNSDGVAIAAAAFTLNFDPECLQFDTTDSNSDGIPNSITTAQAGFSLGFSSAAAQTGALRFVLFPAAAAVPLPALADGDLLTVAFQTRCAAATTLTLSNASFGNTAGNSVAGGTVPGTVTISAPPGLRGDCNADAAVDAADLSGLILEIFDGDGGNWLDAPGGSFAGNAAGCDSNADTLIDAGDMACTLRLLVEGSGVQCSAGQGTGAAVLSLPSRLNAAPGQLLQIPVTYQSDGYSASTLTFAIRFDAARLTFAAEDGDGDKIPDGLELSIPAGFDSSAVVVGGNEIRISVYSPTLRRLPDGALATVTFNVRDSVEVTADEAALRFSHAAVNSLGADNGHSLPLLASGILYLLPEENDQLIFLPAVAR